MEQYCWLCGKNGSNDRLEKHHIFQNAYRDKSEMCGAYVFLCGNECHRNGKRAAHKCKETRDALHRYGQRKVMKEYGWNVDKFREEFGKNYLDLEELDGEGKLIT